MKVILLPASAELVGVSVHVYNLAKLLYSNGMLDSVACPSEGWLTTRLSESSIPYSILNISHHPKAAVKSAVAVRAFLRTRRTAEIVHLHGRFPLFVSAGALGTYAGLTPVATVHEFSKQYDNGPLHWKQRLETALLRRMKRVCCVSEDLREEVVTRLGRGSLNRVDFVPNWIEPLSCCNGTNKQNASLTAIRRNSKTICAAGRLSPEKGFDVLLRAVSILRSEGKNAKCKIYGAGPEKANLVRLARELNLISDVAIENPTSDLRKILPDFDVLVVPSRSESFGIIVLEAYDAGVPLIASDVPGLRCTVQHGATALLFPPGDHVSLAAKLRELFESPSLGESLATKGRRYLESYASLDELTDAYVRFYHAAQKSSSSEISA
jgi:glycosyltransferase involved in cell wall biosynthesis